MPTLCKPSVAVPENVVTLKNTIDILRDIHANHPQLDLAMRLIRNVDVAKRHIVRPIDEILQHPGLTRRNEIYELEAKKRIPAVVEEALRNGGLDKSFIDAIVMVSCTGFLMPSLTAWMINELGFRSDVAQIPIAQMGCAAGGTAINRSFDYCVAHPGANVLIVACEFCSLCYQPTDIDVGSLLSKALFGDALACAVVRGDGGRGISLLGGLSHLLPDTEKWITYEVKETGFHFRLNKGVAVAMRAVAPVCETFVASYGFDVSTLDYYIFHTGGPRILDTMRDYASIDNARLEFSRETLRQFGNIASASIFDVALRIFREPHIRPSATFLLAGFGPGITAEMAFGTWI